MNIIITTPTYYPFAGGAEALIEDLAREYSKQGHKVTVVTNLNPDVSTPISETRNGVEILRIDPLPEEIGRIGGLPSFLWRYATRILKLQRIISHKNANLLCIGLFGLDTLSVVLATYLIKPRLAVIIHGGEVRRVRRISRLYDWSLMSALRRCDVAVAVSKKLLQDTAEYMPSAREKLTFISNGVDLGRIRKAEGIRRERYFILFVGRLDRVKSIDTLIDAFSLISGKMPLCDLLIVGEGREDASLRGRVSGYGLSGRVEFLGKKDRDEVYSYMKGCEFLVLPSVSEGLPLVVLEAMACGKVVLGSDVDGISELIDDGMTGALFPRGDSIALSEAILRYYLDAGGRARIEENLCAKDMGEYDLNEVAKKHLTAMLGGISPHR
jgi:glycosyltransferase involved in cell wall biosynthesis